MSMIGIRVPHETGRLLTELDVPGERESMDGLHITLLYIGKSTPIEEIAKAMVTTYSVTTKTRPFTVRTNRLTCFPRNDDGVPIICRIDSDPLHDFRANLAAAFDTAGVAYNNKFPDYSPHVTLSYADEMIEEMRIPTVEWGAHEVVLWGGDDGDRKIIVTFPFSLETVHEAGVRVASRYSTMVPPKLLTGT